MRISVIIVNYNVRYFLELCLYSLMNAAKGHDVEIIVADNHSTDDSIAYLSGRFHEVRFLSLGGNMGFAKANNKALAIATGEYVLFLNPDTVVPETLFTSALKFFREHPDAGAIGFRMVDGQGQFLKESKRSFPGFWTSLFKFIGLAYLFPRSHVFARYYLGHLDEKKPSPVPVLSGAAMMVKKSLLDALSGFDERFFMYAEDIDLSIRILQHNQLNYYNPETTLVHFKGESSPKNAEYYKRFYGAMALFIKKYTGIAYPTLLSFILQQVIKLRITISLLWSTTAAMNSRPSSFALLGNMPDHVLLDDPASPNRLYVAGGLHTFKECIQRLEEEGMHRNCFFYAEGSRSIAGSFSSNSSGAAFLLHQTNL